MGLDNVAVQWPRTGKFYEPVDPKEFADFITFAEKAPPNAGPAAALATVIARSATVHAVAYTELVDLLLGMEGVLYATENSVSDEDPVIDPDGCEWLAGGLERFVVRHTSIGEVVTFESITQVMQNALAEARQADKELRWLDSRLGALLDEHRNPPVWNFSLLELDVLARFYRRCAERSFAVYADF
ncbi:MAG TPA: hypothetical protein VH561_06850 [Micromonosporaceae bacterium]|jgi:hypothetical protein